MPSSGRKRKAPLPESWLGFPDRLRYAAAIERLDGVQLAEKSGVESSTISRIYNRRAQETPAPTVILLAQALGVRAGWLLSGEEPMRGTAVIVTDGTVSLEHAAGAAALATRRLSERK